MGRSRTAPSCPPTPPAVIKVYELGDLKGEAIYDSRGGGFRLDKWKDAEGKIRELVDELFPT
jgi:hypothetical protein